MKALWKIVAIGLLCAGTVIVNAADLPREADQIVAAFDGFSKADLERMRRSTTGEAVKSFEDATAFISKVAASDVSEDEKALLIAKVADAAGEFFEKLTEPYSDPAAAPRKWAELAQDRNYQNPFMRALKWTKDRFVWTASVLGRDFMRAIPFGKNEEGNWRPMWPYVFPFIGTDRNRSVAAYEIAKDFSTKLNAELGDTEKAMANPLVLAGLKRLLGKMEQSEPIKYGGTHTFVRRMYLGLAIFCFLNPPIEPFLERTTYSPLVSAVMWTAGFMYLMRVRRQDSGLDSYKVVTKVIKAIEKDPKKKAVWDSCGKTLANLHSADK